MLANAFEALKTFDWGTDLNALNPIEDATIAAHGNAGAGQDIENRLIAALNGELSRDAQGYVCRKLALVGTAVAVPTLAGLLGSKATSHMARYALERITAPEAGNALRASLIAVSGDLKIGVISSLGTRREAASVAPLRNLLQADDPAVARAATLALGAIGTAESAAALRSALRAGIGEKQSVVDALFTCAEALLAANNKAEAMSIYNSLSGEQQSRLTRLAATRGILACAGNRS